MTRPILCVGAGFSGAVIARRFAEAGRPAVVIDERAHVAGNCHTEQDAETGVMVHRYGPHIFHTADDEVWNYVNRFARFRPYVNRVKAVAGGRVFALPINLHTINQFFGLTLSPAEAQAHIAALAEDIAAPTNFEEQALSMVGRDLYEAFFRGYTAKQWGVDPTRLPAAILKRLPLRFTYDDNYFSHPHQGIPEDGYTALVAAILDHPLIETRLGEAHAPGGDWAHVFWSGPLDRYFGHRLGRLGYRTLDFEELRAEGDLLGCAVMNYCDADIPWTRITDHKHFAPWRPARGSVAYREYPRACGPEDIPYYPLRLIDDKRLLAKYVALAEATPGVTFVGRLGTYRYLDMDVTIAEALATAATALAAMTAGRAPAPFHVDPLARPSKQAA